MSLLGSFKSFTFQQIGLLAQIPLSFLLLTSLNLLNNLGLELSTTLLNGCLFFKENMRPSIICRKKREKRKKRKNEETNGTISRLQVYLDSRSYLTYVISNVFLSCPFERYFSTDNADKDANLILCLVNLVTAPTER